jgi:AcrR family transcriptional regulator
MTVPFVNTTGVDAMTVKAGPAADQVPETAGDGAAEDGSARSHGVDAPHPGSRPMRADAVKNRTRILAAAEEIFATQGVSVPIDTVAERAGLGVGTLYRHFPTKEALFEAIVMARLESLLETAKRRADAEDPGEALFSFLREFAHQASVKRDLFEALGSAGIDIKSRCAATIDDMKQRIDRLLVRAVAAGDVRPDVSTEETIGLVVGVCQAGGQSGYDDATLERMVTIVCDGLRPR